MSELAIETINLTKNYDGNAVVKQLDLQVKENQIFGLLGPNGAGKTTTILMLLGLTEPTSGKVSVCGLNPVRNALKVKRLTGYLPEKVGFYEYLSPRENLQFIADLNGIGYQDADLLINDILKRVGLTEAADTAVGKFSRGMKQRLGIAEVLIKKPKIAILDEPTAGLDPKGINELLEIITGLPGEGTTVILSSHQLYQVQKVCHQVGILSKGTMVIQGDIAQLGRDALAGGRYIIELETVNPGEDLVKKIGRITDVSKVETKGNTLYVSTDKDLRAEISKAVVNANYPLTNMKIQEFSLDDVYMKYFKEE